jgi:hypothetical protein
MKNVETTPFFSGPITASITVSMKSLYHAVRAEALNTPDMISLLLTHIATLG